MGLFLLEDCWQPDLISIEICSGVLHIQRDDFFNQVFLWMIEYLQVEIS